MAATSNTATNAAATTTGGKGTVYTLVLHMPAQGPVYDKSGAPAGMGPLEVGTVIGTLTVPEGGPKGWLVAKALGCGWLTQKDRTLIVRDDMPERPVVRGAALPDVFGTFKPSGRADEQIETYLAQGWLGLGKA